MALEPIFYSLSVLAIFAFGFGIAAASLGLGVSRLFLVVGVLSLLCGVFGMLLIGGSND